MPKFQMNNEELVATTMAVSLGVQVMSAILKRKVDGNADLSTVVFEDEDANFFLQTCQMAGTMLFGLTHMHIPVDQIEAATAEACLHETRQIAAKVGSQLNEACTAMLDRIAADSKLNKGDDNGQ